jgi:type IX secretion system PorP/SprF family membrane protein
MKNIIRTSFLLVILLESLSVFSQQLPNSSQYLVNRYLLSPSFAGHNEKTQIFIGYRNAWSGFEGASETSMVNGYFPASENGWLGAQVISDKADLFSNIYAKFSYTTRIKIGYDNMLYFGLWGSFFQNKISLTKAIIFDPNDPLLQGKKELTGFSMNAGASIIYKWRSGFIGISIPYLFQNKDVYALTSINNIVELNQQIIGHISYNFRINYNWNIEPILVCRWTKDFASQTEISAILYYRDNYWIATTYRDIGKAGVSIGGNFTKDFTLNYTFEFVTKTYIAQPTSTHEFTLGFTFPKRKYKQNKWRNNNRYNSGR